MREVVFLKRNAEKWKEFESFLNSDKKVDPDYLADLYVQITDDLSYARTFYPKSKATVYLNSIALKAHQKIYRRKREDKGRIARFWRYELPNEMYAARKELLYSFVIFTLSILIGIISAANDDTFVRLILGDSYVSMTLSNIEKGDPMAVYKSMRQVDMFVGITVNNIIVSFYAFAMGVIFSLGTAYVLLQNGVMLGAFQTFFHQHDLLFTSILTIWIHGTLEISAIVIAGCAGLVIGNSFLFPGTYSRGRSFIAGAKRGLKIVVGLVPIFIIAGFLESFITRYTDMPLVVSGVIILGSLAFVIGYFIIYPHVLHKKGIHGTATEN